MSNNNLVHLINQRLNECIRVDGLIYIFINLGSTKFSTFQLEIGLSGQHMQTVPTVLVAMVVPS